MRVPTFVTGGALPSAMHGKSLQGLVSVVDWFATFSELAGLGSAVPTAGPAPPDSISLWAYISGQNTTAPRTSLIHDHHMFTNASNASLCAGQNPFSLPGYDSLGAIRVGRYKLVVGVNFDASWFGQFSPNISGRGDYAAEACRYKPCLFDIETVGGCDA